MSNTAPPASSHRGSLEKRHATEWGAALWAGIIAGIVFMMIEMLLVWLIQGQSPWGPPRMIAGMLLGKEILPPPADFSMKALATAMLIHLPLSALYGAFVGWLVHRLDGTLAAMVGLAFGLAVYGINFHLVAPVAFPWFVGAQNWISVLAHAIFGVGTAVASVALRRR